MPLSRSSSAASPPVTFNAAINVSRTSSAVVAASSLASQTPPGDLATSARPVAIATAVFPIPPGPTISTSRLLVRAGRRGRRSPSRARPARPTSTAGSRRRWRDRRPRECRVVVQDLLLELLQSRSGIEPELVRQLGPDPLVGRQRVGLAARSVQRGDQQLPQAFLVRVRSPRPLPARRSRRRRLRAATAPRTGSRRASCAPRRAAPGAGSTQSPSPAPAARPRGSSSSADALSVGGAAVVAGVEQPSRGDGVAQHGERVDRGRLDGERVAAVAAGDHAADPRAPGAAWRPSTAACCGGC